MQSQILPEIFDRPGHFGILMKRAFIEQFYYRVKQSQSLLWTCAKNWIFDIHSVKLQWITLFLQIAIIIVPLLCHRTFTCLNDYKLTCPPNIILISRQRKMKTSVRLFYQFKITYSTVSGFSRPPSSFRALYYPPAFSSKLLLLCCSPAFRSSMAMRFKCIHYLTFQFSCLSVAKITQVFFWLIPCCFDLTIV